MKSHDLTWEKSLTTNQQLVLNQNAPADLFRYQYELPHSGGWTGHRHRFIEHARIAGYEITNLIFNYHVTDTYWSLKSGVKDIFD